MKNSKNRHSVLARGLIVLTALAWVALPAVGHGDVVKLKDGSMLKGRVLSLTGDTLTIRTSFGSDLRVPRAKISLVSFTDSIPQAATPPAAVSKETESGDGRIAVEFVDDQLSSKVMVSRGRDRQQRLRANWIETLLVVDDVVVYTAVDSVMDKTVYDGPERIYKNSVNLEDFEVTVPAGLHHAALIIRNAGADGDAGMFDGDPLNVTLPLDNMMVAPNRSARVKVGISRGRLRMGKPRLMRVE